MSSGDGGRRTTLVPDSIGKLLRARRFWIILGMLAACTIVHYATPQNRFVPLVGLSLSRHTIERVFFLLPVVAASFAYGQVGGLVTLGVAILLMLPRAIYLSEWPADALVETAIVAVVGYLMVWMIEAQNRERKLRHPGHTLPVPSPGRDAPARTGQGP
jgi:hypothetical protein